MCEGDAPGRAAVLVTGMSGTGKSSVLVELARRGHRVVDTDDPGWRAAAPVADASEPLWDLDRIRSLLATHRSGWLFVGGCVRNQGEVYSGFDAIVLLSAPIEVLLARVSVRDNPFGSTPRDRAQIADDLVTFEPILRAGADQEIDTTAPLREVVRELEDLAAHVRRT